MEHWPGPLSAIGGFDAESESVRCGSVGSDEVYAEVAERTRRGEDTAPLRLLGRNDAVTARPIVDHCSMNRRSAAFTPLRSFH
jgi:hypothetical protein